MAAEISNRTLAFLLVAAIVISLGGTLLSLNKLGEMGALSVTGAATSGNITFQVGIDTSYDVINTDIDFGQGHITGGQSFAILDSDGSGCVNWNNTCTQQFLTIQNDGNVNINVSFTSSANETGFVGGTNPEFNYTAVDAEPSACTIALQTGLNQVVNATGPGPNNVCESLDYANSADSVNVSIRIRVPLDASQTTTQATFTFSASQALN